ncbi:MAG: LamG domain-containing protein, partial [Candidatus Aenigmatarchaeota archaeon]
MERTKFTEFKNCFLILSVFVLSSILLTNISTAAAEEHTIGEAGINTDLSEDEWQTVSLDDSIYDTDPTVVVTTQTTNGGQDPSETGVMSLSTSGFQTQHCEYDSWDCDGHTEEDNAWIALDPGKVQQSHGMDAGFTEISDNDVKTVDFHKTFSNTPIVFAQVVTDDDDADGNSDEPVSAKITNRGTSSADIKLCAQRSTDGCDSNHGSGPEGVAWLAIDPDDANKLDNWDWGTVSVSDSNWNSVSFSQSFGSTPAVLVETQTQSGEEDIIPEADNVGTGEADVRYCEAEGGDSCDTHPSETVAWLAVSTGTVQATEMTSTCEVNDVDIDLRSPAGDTTGWFNSTHSSTSGTCGSDPNTTETWENTSGYSYCPQEGDYDGRSNAYTQEDENPSNYSWETSSWASDIYTVDYDSSSDWCSCGDQYSGNSYNWIGSYTDAGDSSYPNCCEDDRVAWWDFEEAKGELEYQGTTANDRWNDNDGTLNNFDWTSDSGWVDAKDGNYTGTSALAFDGSDDYVEVPADSSHTFGDEDFSISAWIKSDATDWNSIVTQGQEGFGGSTDIRYVFSLRDSNAFMELDDDSTLSSVNGDTTINDNEWHHIVGIRDTSSDELILYVDGSQDGVSSDDTGSIADADGILSVGAAAWDDNYFPGSIDEVRIYNRALEQAEIQEIYEKGV